MVWNINTINWSYSITTSSIHCVDRIELKGKTEIVYPWEWSIGSTSHHVALPQGTIGENWKKTE